MSRECPIDWNTEMVELLERMWSRGFTARQIAELIPRATRSAVIGKAHRLFLKRGPRIWRPSPTPPPPVIPAPKLRGVVAHPPKPGHCADCGCTAQPGRDRCAECNHTYIEATRPNKRAGQWNGIGGGAA